MEETDENNQCISFVHCSVFMAHLVLAYPLLFILFGVLILALFTDIHKETRN